MTDKKKFTIKLILFLFFSIIVPCAYITIRFNLFTSKNAISLWGIIIICLIFLTISVLIKYYLAGMKTKWSYLKQLLEGFCKIILPIIVILVITIFLKMKLQWLCDNMNLFIEVLIVILASEIIAVVINPLSKWAFDNNVQGLIEITDKIIKKGEGE